MIIFAIMAAAHVSAARSLSDFEFKGFVAGKLIDQSQIGQCDENVRDSCTAKLESDEIGGYKPLSVLVTTYKSRLSYVSILSDVVAFGFLTDAFKAKYGKPCAVSAPMWTSRIGRPVPNPTYTWCFASGKLKATMHGALIDVSEIEYRDLNAAPKSKAVPKIDF